MQMQLCLASGKETTRMYASSLKTASEKWNTSLMEAFMLLEIDLPSLTAETIILRL